jgi:hypothetical protein
MYIWRRVLDRARVLMEGWFQENAFYLGILFGGGVRLAVIFAR